MTNWVAQLSITTLPTVWLTQQRLTIFLKQHPSKNAQLAPVDCHNEILMVKGVTSWQPFKLVYVYELYYKKSFHLNYRFWVETWFLFKTVVFILPWAIFCLNLVTGVESRSKLNFCSISVVKMPNLIQVRNEIFPKI